MNWSIRRDAACPAATGGHDRMACSESHRGRVQNVQLPRAKENVLSRSAYLNLSVHPSARSPLRPCLTTLLSRRLPRCRRLLRRTLPRPRIVRLEMMRLKMMRPGIVRPGMVRRTSCRMGPQMGPQMAAGRGPVPRSQRRNRFHIRRVIRPSWPTRLLLNHLDRALPVPQRLRRIRVQPAVPAQSRQRVLPRPLSSGRQMNSARPSRATAGIVRRPTLRGAIVAAPMPDHKTQTLVRGAERSRFQRREPRGPVPLKQRVRCRRSGAQRAEARRQ